MLMRMLRVAAVLSIIVVVLGIVGINLVLSVKEDASAMREENLGVFLVMPESHKVELAVVLVQSTGEVVLLRERQSTGVNLREVLRNSEREGAYSLVGRELEGYTFTGSGVSTVKVRIDRIAVVDDAVLVDVLAPAGEQRVVQEFGGVTASTVLDAEKLVELLRGNLDAVTWKVSVSTPLLQVERSVGTSELLRLAALGGVEMDEELVKAYVLAEFGKQASPALHQEQTIATVLSAYRDGRIRIYPENTLTRALRYLPESILMRMVGAV